MNDLVFVSPTTPVRPLAASDRVRSAMIINLRFADRHIPVFMPPNLPSSPAPCSLEEIRRTIIPDSGHRVDRVDYHFFETGSRSSGLAQYGKQQHLLC